MATTPAVKDKTLVTSGTYTQGMATKEPVLNASANTTADFYRGDKTWQNFASTTRAVTLSGLSVADSSTVLNSDSLLASIGKLQAQATAAVTSLGNKINSSEKGAVNGVATLGADQKVPAAQLPSYVDDVVEIATKAALPATGETGKIYLVLADESRNGATEQYRWSGSVFTRIPTSPGSTDEVTEGATRLYFTTARVLATVLSGLSLVTGTPITAADTVLNAFGKLQKQISDLTTTVSGKEGSIATGTAAQYFRGDKTWQDFATDVRAVVLTGLSTATNAAIGATDSVLIALGKLQKQITDLSTTVSGKEGSIATGTTAQYYRGDKSWQDLATAVRGAVLTGLSTATVAAIAAGDSVLSAFGKLQAQITDAGVTKATVYGSVNLSNVVGGWGGFSLTGVTGGGSFLDNSTSHGYWRAATAFLWTCDNNGLFLAKGDIGSSSDETLKTNWRAVGPDFIKQLARVKHGIYDRTDIEVTQVGVSAQSVLKEVPDLEHTVHEGQDGKLTLAYANAALVSAVELAADAVRKDEIIAQQAELIQKLIERVTALENKSA